MRRSSEERDSASPGLIVLSLEARAHFRRIRRQTAARHTSVNVCASAVRRKSYFSSAGVTFAQCTLWPENGANRSAACQTTGPHECAYSSNQGANADELVPWLENGTTFYHGRVPLESVRRSRARARFLPKSRPRPRNTTIGAKPAAAMTGSQPLQAIFLEPGRLCGKNLALVRERRTLFEGARPW